jgi:hypothetical protein
MLRSEYLQLREKQQDISLGVARWDTADYERLKALESVLVRRLVTEEAELVAGGTPRPRPEPELRSRVIQSRDLLTYLRALCYLRQHGIMPHWPQGSATGAAIGGSASRG